MTERAKPLRPEQGLVPPHDLDAEASVLSACLLEPRAFDQVSGRGLKPEMFYSQANKLIFGAIEALNERGEPFDLTTVASHLRNIERLRQAGDAVYLAQIVDTVPAVSNVESYARIVIDNHRRRQMIATLREHIASGYGAIESTQRYLDEVEQDVARIARLDAASTGLVHVSGHASELNEGVVEAFREGKAPGTPYGFADLDRKTQGLHDTDLVVVAGRPGMGKTAFVLSVATRVADRPPADGGAASEAVAFFSLEMSGQQLALRAVCSEQKLESQRISQGRIRHDEWTQLSDGIDWLSRLPIWVDETPQLTLAQIRSRARRLKADIERGSAERPASRLGLVVIDYLQLAGDPAGKLSREQVVSQNTRDTKALAKELGVPVILLSQLNRGVENRPDKRPQLSDLRESGAIEQDADLVLFLYRDEYYNTDSLDRGVAEVLIGKQRNGPTGKVKLRFTTEHTRFDDLAEGDYDFDDMDFEQAL